MADLKPAKSILVQRPLLPRAERLLPYLREIDETRVYSNFGALALRLGSRLEARFALPMHSVIVAASGTAALIGAILAAAGRATIERPYALLPSFTFVATAAAAQACGYEPLPCDVDEKSLTFSPKDALEHPDLDRIGLVLPVGAFGIGLRQADWLGFRRASGVPVVIDGAACFEAACETPDALLGEIPVVMSFHATKSFSSGEGGCVITTDRDLAKKTVQGINFGFYEVPRQPDGQHKRQDERISRRRRPRRTRRLGGKGRSLARSR